MSVKIKQIALYITFLLLAAIVIDYSTQTHADSPIFPPLTGFVVDEANVLTPDEEAEVTKILSDLAEGYFGDEYKARVIVATVPDLQGFTYEDYVDQLYVAWGVGEGFKNRGLLLLIYWEFDSDICKRMQFSCKDWITVKPWQGSGFTKAQGDAFALARDLYLLPRIRYGRPGDGVIEGVSAMVRTIIGKGFGCGMSVFRTSEGCPDRAPSPYEE